MGDNTVVLGMKGIIDEWAVETHGNGNYIQIKSIIDLKQRIEKAYKASQDFMNRSEAFKALLLGDSDG